MPSNATHSKEWLLDHHRTVSRGGASLLLGFAASLLVIGLADSVQTPRWAVLLLSPGYVPGTYLSMGVQSFGTSLQVMGCTELCLDLAYWSSMFFLMFTIISRLQHRGK